MTCRSRYVPQVGQAACGSFGLRHCGQLSSVGADVFHCERRECVLLRDILRLGTATSALLSIFRGSFCSCIRLLLGGAGRMTLLLLVRNIKLAERGPPGVHVLAMSVVRARLGEVGTALRAQPRAVFPAQR